MEPTGDSALASILAKVDARLQCNRHGNVVRPERDCAVRGTSTHARCIQVLHEGEVAVWRDE